jgi:serine/threonine protein kinase
VIGRADGRVSSASNGEFTFSVDAKDDTDKTATALIAGWFINPSNGAVSATCPSPGSYAWKLVAVNYLGGKYDVLSKTVEVVARPVLRVVEGSFARQPADAATRQLVFDGNETVIAAGDFYVLPPVDLTRLRLSTGPVGGNHQFSVIGAPPGFLIDPRSGLMQGQASLNVTSSNRYQMVFSITDTNAKAGPSQSAVLQSVYVQVKQKDTSRAGVCKGAEEDEVEFDGNVACPDAKGDSSMVIIVVLVTAILAAGIAYSAAKYREHKQSMLAFDFRVEMERLAAQGALTEEQLVDRSVPRELKRSCVTIVKKICEGQFGEVAKGSLDEYKDSGIPAYMVAIKTVHDHSGPGADDLLHEATVMAQVSGHPNLVALIGVVTRGTPMMMVLQICEQGSLLEVLRKRADGYGVLLERPKSVERMGYDVAKGMRHLARKKFIHRDLAARNILLNEDMACMVADFGLSRGATKVDEGDAGYYRSTSGVFPLRWTAPESMLSLHFSTASDVWSFAIVLFEALNGGALPYKGLSNEQVIAAVTSGYKMSKPENCSSELYEVMLECLHASPEKRCDFEALVIDFERLCLNHHSSGSMTSVQNDPLIPVQAETALEHAQAKPNQPFYRYPVHAHGVGGRRYTYSGSVGHVVSEEAAYKPARIVSDMAAGAVTANYKSDVRLEQAPPTLDQCSSPRDYEYMPARIFSDLAAGAVRAKSNVRLEHAPPALDQCSSPRDYEYMPARIVSDVAAGNINSET